MPDEALELKRSILAGVRRAISDHEGMVAAEFGQQGLLPGTGLGARAGPDSPPQIFATGYDAGTGTTTTGFMFDLSLFDSGDRLT